MAPADSLSPPGSASYSSDTLHVGDGTWDFTKESFLLPNLVGLNFDTMRYNGMGNRFATLTQYHTLITAHGVLAVITFLFLVPAAVMIKRFHRARYHETNVRTHAYLNILAVGFSTVVFILGFFAVGPNRALSNPHHGIGVAIYVLILIQAFGGRMIRNVRGHSFRAHCHRWMGRMIGLLGIVQIPLGLTLYGSPKWTFVLYALWMAFVVLVYFVLSHTRGEGGGDYVRGGRSEGGRGEKKKGGGMMGWLVPAAAGAAAIALLRGGSKKKDERRERSVSRSRSRSRARSVSRTRSRSRGPEVIASRRGSDSYVDEKYERRRDEGGGGGFMSKALGVGAAVGAGALFSKMLGRNKGRDRHDEEYSAVATDTPSRSNRSRRHRPPPSEYSDDYTVRSGHTRGSILPPPNPTAAAAALGAAEMRPGASGGRPAPPTTPQRSHMGRSAVESGLDASDYSSYVSPSRRASERRKSTAGGVGKGLLAGLGFGWFANKMRGRKGDYREEDRLRAEEDERRAGHYGSRFTADGYPSPTRSHSRRQRPARPLAPASAVTSVTDESSMVEPRPVSGYGGPPMAPMPPGGVQPPPPGGYVPPPAPVPHVPVGLRASRSGSRSRHEMGESAAMPPMPPDHHGMLHESGSESYFSGGGPPPQRRNSSRRRREGEAAAAAAAATASRLAAEEDERRHGGRGGQPVSVKMKIHDDPDRNVTLRRVPADERDRTSRQRSNSTSTLSADDTPSNRRYRRESSRGRAELAAERRVEHDDGPLAPPNPAFAAGRRPKDSAYYSGGGGGQPGPSGGTPAAGATVSSLGSPGSHGTWSALSPSPSGPMREGSNTASAADRRRRRRLERRDDSRRPSGTVEYS
ncbi:hypothetical protein GE09DRAFT_1286351 [Coniochaeta sp. 2T2.1]|nr:hypothetical protein GE09DRAFT_1286351 [Coniochaeta sp. 2T2.1]